MSEGLRCLVLICVALPCAQAQKIAREEGEFKIQLSGSEIGSEKFIILTSDAATTSSSTLEFRNPGEKRQRVQIETKLEMDGRFVPRSYLLKSDVEGKKGTILGNFTPNQAMFEYGGGAQKSGLLVGADFTILDTNIFHHFIFLARLFKFGSRDKSQRFEVVIPQERDSGFLNVREMPKETLTLRGRKLDAHHLQLDSGALQIQLWLDNGHILQRISVPSKGLHVIRDP